MGFSLGFGSSKGRSSSNQEYDVSGTENVTQTQTGSESISQTGSGSTSEQMNALMQSLGLSSTQMQQLQQSVQNTVEQQTQQQLQQSLEQQQQTGSSVTQNAQTQNQAQRENVQQSNFAGQDIEAIRAVLPQLFGQSMENFQTASGGALPQQIAAIQRQLTEATLPQIQSQEAAGGAYNSTSNRFLANDAIARGAELAANLQLEASRTAGQATQPLLQLAEILKGAESSTEGSTDILSSLLGTSATQTQQNTTTAGSTSTTGQTTGTSQSTGSTSTTGSSTEQNQQTQQTQQDTTGQSTTQQDSQSFTQQELEALSAFEEEGTSTSSGRTKSSGFSFGFG